MSKGGYSMVLCISDNKSDKESAYLDFLIEKGVDGIIMVPASSDNSKKVKEIDIPIVFVDRYIKNVDINYVGVNNEKAGYQAVEHLIKLGHKTIGFITGPFGESCSEERINGYKKL